MTQSRSMALRRSLSLIVVLAALTLPASASADIFCFGSPAGPCDDSTATSIQQALGFAATNPGNDMVKVGVGTFAEGGIQYTGGDGDVALVGSGQDQTIIAPPSSPAATTALSMSGGAATVSDLTIRLNPSDSDNDKGLSMFGSAQAIGVEIDGDLTDNTTGLELGGATFSDGVISMPLDSPNGTRAVFSSGGGAIFGSQLTADTTAQHSTSSGSLTISRSELHPGSRGAWAELGTVNVDNTVIDLEDGMGAAIYARNDNLAAVLVSVTLDHVSIVGGGVGSVGVHAAARAPQSQQSDVTVTNTLIEGPQTSIQVLADDGDPATVTTRYSNYSAPTLVDPDINDTGPVGIATLSETNKTAFDPGFVDPGTDHHLSASSALIDMGDPAPPSPGTTDIDGDARPQDGPDFECGARRDIGADEFVLTTPDPCHPPVTQITGGPSGPTPDNTPTFTFGSEPGSSFACRVDAQPFAPCSGPGGTHAVTPALPDGPHTFRVRATDVDGNLEASPPARSFNVDATAPDTAIGGKRKVRTKRKRTRVRFTVSSEAGATLECSLDGAVFSSCSSVFTARVRRGRHTLRARGTDALGNTDASPASFAFRVVKKKRKRR